jgi:hypothetical protein
VCKQLLAFFGLHWNLLKPLLSSSPAVKYTIVKRTAKLKMPPHTDCDWATGADEPRAPNQRRYMARSRDAYGIFLVLFLAASPVGMPEAQAA